MPSERSELRKARYKYLTDLGFSSVVARRYRDHSSFNIEGLTKSERRRISRKAVERRSPAESERLERIRQEQETVTFETRQRRYAPKRERLEDFSRWSNKFTGFPDWALERIHAYNSAAGKSRDDSFGYRRFYYWYVERIGDFENEFYADRGDSGIRYQFNIPLRSRREIRSVA